MTDSILRTHRWDWFSVPFEWGKALAHVPGFQYKDGRFLVHRSHLVLLDQPEVLEALSSASHTLPVAAFTRAQEVGITLRPWQASGLGWIEPRRGVLLADEMRLGKTLTALLAHDPRRGPLVVVAPLDTRPVWAKAFALAFPDLEAEYLTGKTLELDREFAPIVFCHYDILLYHKMTRLQPGTLILDEAHLLSNPTSKRTKAVLFYASVAKKVIVLSGTPLWNSTKGLWPLLAAASPGAWGKLYDFAQRYCQPELTEYGWKYNGVSNREEWLARRSEVVLARTWKEVRPDLPPIERKVTRIALDTDDSLAVDVAAVELAQAGTEHLDITVLSRYRQAVGKFKVNAAVNVIERRGGPIVIWVWHKTVARAIAKRLKDVPVFVMTGDDDGAARADTIEAWNRESCGVLIATLAVGQVGIDLSHADHEVFVEVDWTPAVLSQAEMRTFSPDRPMTVEYLVLGHEIDEALMTAVLRKLERGNRLDMAAAGSSFTIEEPNSEDDANDLLRELGALLLAA